MDKKEQFYDVVNKEMAITLATAAGERVTMRQVSPVLWGKDILIFTDHRSRKYRQLEANPHCCLSAGAFFAEATAEFLGETMAQENAGLRELYRRKFPAAFEENADYAGRDCAFVLLHPTKLKGWAFENDVPSADGVPTLPFELELP